MTVVREVSVGGLLNRLRESLGIDFHVRRLTIDVEVNDVPFIICERYPRDENGKRLPVLETLHGRLDPDGSIAWTVTESMPLTVSKDD